MWHLWFDIGGFVFWSIIALEFIIFSVNRDSYSTATASGVVIFATLAVFLLFSNLTTTAVYQFVIHNPLKDAMYVLAYIALGIVWAIFNWAVLFLPTVIEDYKERRSSYKDYDADGKEITKLRSAKYNSGRIIDWMIFWPFSIVHALFGNLTYRIYKTVYNHIANLMQAISDSVAKKYDL